MSIILFIIIIGVLIFVHELGHFLVAKAAKVRVDEFAIGFPPRLFSWKKGETNYSINLIPLGGYVKIFGENPDSESLDPNRADSFLNKSRWTQAAVLVAGVVFNIVFAWILFSISLMSGFPSVVTEQNAENINESFVVVTNVLENSPAEEGGLQIGDQILELNSVNATLEQKDLTVTSLQQFISNAEGEITAKITRQNSEMVLNLTPQTGIIGDRQAVGISIDRIGSLKYPFFESFWRGFLMTGQMIKEMALGLGYLLSTAFSGQGSLDDVAGPIGIVQLVDNASNFGLAYLLGFTAFISVNLAILNILPLPALDGGRLLILLIEGVIRRRIKPTIVNNINAIGFLALILLMIVITINDVINLF